MAKQKKIGFKYFLNKRADQEIDLEGTYPVYVRITFDRRSTKMPPYAFLNLQWTPERLERFEAGKPSNIDKENFEIIEACERLIENVIRYEYRKNPDFTIIGSSNLIHTYQKTVENVISISILLDLKNATKYSMIAKNYFDIFGENLSVNQLNLEEVLKAILKYYGSWDKLKNEINETTSFQIEAFCAYKEFQSHFHFEEFSGTLYKWLVQNERKVMTSFLREIDPEEYNFLPLNGIEMQTDKLDLFVQYIDNELTKVLLQV